LTLDELDVQIQKATTVGELKPITRALLKYIHRLEISFKVIKLECDIGLAGDVETERPSDWPGDW